MLSSEYNATQPQPWKREMLQQWHSGRVEVNEVLLSDCGNVPFPIIKNASLLSPTNLTLNEEQMSKLNQQVNHLQDSLKWNNHLYVHAAKFFMVY